MLPALDEFDLEALPPCLCPPTSPASLPNTQPRNFPFRETVREPLLQGKGSGSEHFNVRRA